MRSPPESNSELAQRLQQLRERCQQDQQAVNNLLVKTRAGQSLAADLLDQFQRQLANGEEWKQIWTANDLDVLRQYPSLEQQRLEVVGELEQLSNSMNELNNLLVEELAGRHSSLRKSVQEYTAQQCYLRNQS